MAEKASTGQFPDAETLALCERFSLWLRQSGGVRVQGRPLPAGVSHGLDFDRFARYRPGMDLRHVDWTLYARTRRVYVRQYVDEGAGVLAVVLDGSGSMALGGKWELARRLAAVLTFAALRELHAVALVVVTAGGVRALPPTGGLDFADAAFAFLAAQRPEGPTDLGAAAAAVHGPGAGGDAVFISDFLDPRGADQGVEALARQGFRVDLCRITAAGELDLPPAGHAVFDPEGEGHRVVPGGPARARLEAAIAAHRATLAETAARYGAPLIELAAETPLPQALEQYFRAIAAAHAPRGAAVSLALPLALVALGVLPALVWLHRRARPTGDRPFSAFFLVAEQAGEGRAGRRLRAPMLLAARAGALVALALAAAGPVWETRPGTLVLAAGPFAPDPAWDAPVTVVRAGQPPSLVEGAVAPVAGPPDWGGALLLGLAEAPGARVVRVPAKASTTAITGGAAARIGAEIIVTATTRGPGEPALEAGALRLPMTRRQDDWAVRGVVPPGPARIVVEGAEPWPVCVPNVAPVTVAEAGWPAAVAGLLDVLPGVARAPATEARWRPGPAPARGPGWAAFAPAVTWFAWGEEPPTEASAPLLFARHHPPPGAAARRWRPLAEPADVLLFAGAAPVVDRGEGPAGVGVRFGFLPEDTDLPDTAGWPVLFVDLLERDRSGPCRVHAAGRPLLLQAEADVTVTGPAGESRTLPARGGRVVVDALDQQGLYTLASAGREAWVAVVPPLVTTPPAAAALSAPTSPPAPRRQPWVLASLALLALVLVLSRRWATPLAWPALVLAGIALADPRPGGEPGQVVLAVDTSDSMPRDETPAAVDALRRRLPAATTQIEGAGEVGRAHAGGPPTLGGRRTRHGPLIAAAARLAGPGGVIVLLTDGRAEDGPVASPLPVVVVPARAAPDARVLGARALRLGPQVFVHATLAADREVAATVTVGEVSLPVALGPDARAVQAVVPAGAQVIEVRVAAAGDPVAANDALPVAVEGGRPPAAVVVGGGAVGWAESAGLGAREVPGAGLVEAGAGLGLVRAMFIHDQPAATFPPAVTAGLARWVAAGGVLVLAGRADAFGPGGWAGTPLDDLSPLRADPREPAASRVRVALALDRSGSMAREAGGIGPEAVGTLAASLAGSLRPRDEVGVLAFGLDAEALLAPTPVEKLTADGLQVPALVRGGTRLGPALALARRQLAGAQERVLVVLSDGRFSDAEAPALEAEAAALEGAGVRVVAVLTGEDPSREPLASLARRTGGTVVQAAGGQVERYATAGVLGAVSDGFFAPGGPVVAGSGWAARVGGAPPAVDRRVRVAARPEARVLAEAGGDPLLAEWAIGQGRVIALATDRWDLGADQWAALLAPAVAPRPADAALELEDGLLVFQGLAEDPPPHGLVVVEGQGGSVAVPWHPVGPGRAVAALPPGDTEVLTISSPSPRGAVQARVTRPPPAELRATGADAGAVALQARLSGGRVAEVGDAAAAVAALRGRQPGTPLAPWLLLLAVLALALDAARWAGLGRPLAVSTGRRRPFGRT